MKNSLRTIACSLLFTLALAPGVALAGNAVVDLITDGDFTQVYYTGSKALTTVPAGTMQYGQMAGGTVMYGQVGTGSGSTLRLGTAAVGATAATTNWSTTGYNFLYAPGTADFGTQSGATAGHPLQAPGQATANGYGNTFLWGKNNSSIATTAPAIPTNPPAGGNFLAADGAYEVGAISQTVNGLTVGQATTLGFWWAAGQQQGFTGKTSEQWKVSLGGTTIATPVIQLSAEGFSGWQYQTMGFVPTATTETLSFLASGSPNGQPPFVLLNGVSLEVPEPSSWIFFIGLGAVFTVIGVMRRRRRSACPADELS